MLTASEEAGVLDGELDSRCSISHLTEEEIQDRKDLYEKFFLKDGHLRTAAGQDLPFDIDTIARDMDWVKDDNVSIAMTACDLCSEINACRPEGTPAFACLVKARPRSKRSDGTSRCALCMIVRRGTNESADCRARGGKEPDHCIFGLKKQHRRKSGGGRKRGRPKKRIANDDDDEMSDGSLFGCDPSDEEDGASTEANPLQNQEQAGNGNENVQRPKVTRSGRQSRPSQVLNPEGDYNAGIDRTRTQSGRVVRPAKPFSSGAKKPSRPSAPKPTSTTRSQDHAAQSSPVGKIIPTRAPPPSQQKADVLPQKLSSAKVERTRLLRQDCIVTARKLLSFESDELDAELATEE